MLMLYFLYSCETAVKCSERVALLSSEIAGGWKACVGHTHPHVFSVVEVSPSKVLLDLHVDHKCDNVRINKLSNGIRVRITAKEYNLPNTHILTVCANNDSN